MPARKTKIENGTSTEVLTRKARKLAAVRIVEETNAEPVKKFDEELELEGVAGAGDQERSPKTPRKTRNAPKGSKGTRRRAKRATESEIDKTSLRHAQVLKDTFDELNTDVRFTDFHVISDTTLSMYPGLLLINAQLLKGDHFICAVARYVVDYPDTVKDIAFTLYEQMMFDGLYVAEIIGG